MRQLQINDHVCSKTSPFVCQIIYLGSFNFDIKIVNVKQGWNGDVDFMQIGETFYKQEPKNYCYCDISGKILDETVCLTSIPKAVSEDICGKLSEKIEPIKYKEPAITSKVMDLPFRECQNGIYTLGKCPYYYDVLSEDYIGEKLNVYTVQHFSKDEKCYVLRAYTCDGEDLLVLESELLEYSKNKCINNKSNLKSETIRAKQDVLFEQTSKSNIPQLDFTIKSFDLKPIKPTLPKLKF